MEKKNMPAQHEFAEKLYLKVNIQCCEACPRKAKEKLQKLPGVVAVSVDTERGLVAVSGTVDPEIVIQKFANLGKKAVLVSPPSNPIQYCSRGKSTQFNRHNDAKKRYPAFCCHEDDSGDDHICDGINLWQSHHGITMINQRRVPHDVVNYKPSAPTVGTKMGENSCCLTGLFGRKKYAVAHNKFPDVGPGFRGATAAAGFGLNNNGQVPGRDMYMPYAGASRHHQYHGPTVAHGNQYPAARPPAYPHYQQAMYPSAPPLQPSGFTQSRAHSPPTEFCPMIHYNRYEDDYY